MTAHWQEECQLDSHIVSALTPMVDFQTGNISYKSYNEFFGTDDHTQIERVEFAYEALKRMQSYADDSLLAVGEGIIILMIILMILMIILMIILLMIIILMLLLMIIILMLIFLSLLIELVDVIKEWSDAKTVFVELDLIIEKEKGKVRTELTKQINSLKGINITNTSTNTNTSTTNTNTNTNTATTITTTTIITTTTTTTTNTTNNTITTTKMIYQNKPKRLKYVKTI